MSLSLFCAASRGESSLFLWWKKWEAASYWPSFICSQLMIASQQHQRPDDVSIKIKAHSSLFLSSLVGCQPDASGWFSEQNWTKKFCFIGKSTSTSKLFFPSAFYKFNDFAFGFITARQVSPSVSIEPLPNNVIQSRCFGNMGCPHLLHRAIEDKQLFLAPKTWYSKVDPKMR